MSVFIEQNARQLRTWIRLIASTATVLLPSFFSPQSSAAAQSTSHRRAPSKHEPGAIPAGSVPTAFQAGKPAPAAILPRRAEVLLQNGLLRVDANNSELSQILQDVSQQTGMSVAGAVPSNRVFGHYGPLPPPELLTELLSGLGYNILMTGSSTQGAPKELTLSLRNGAVTPPQLNAQKEPELGPGAVRAPAERYELPQTRVYEHDRRLQQMHEALEKQSTTNEH